MDIVSARELTNLLSSYLSNREAMSKQAQDGDAFGNKGTTVARVAAFNQMVTQHANQLAAIMPTMNLMEWHALSELAGSRIAALRMVGKK